MKSDKSQITSNLWIGAVPTDAMQLPSLGFTHLALCAEEFQFPKRQFKGLEVKRCPMIDVDNGTVINLKGAIDAANWVADSAFIGGQVLVTCAAGINRSALVTALALRLLGHEPSDAVDLIRSRRFPYCLSNDTFLKTALTLPL